MKRIACFLLLFALVLGGCKTPAQKEKDKEKKAAKTAALNKKTKADLRDDSSDVDFQAFVGRLRKAVSGHDVNTLATMMTTDFGYSLGPPERSGPGVFKFWDDQNLWPELDGILSEKFVKKGEYMVAPPQFGDQSLNYDGYRAGIKRVNGSWKFAYFVNG
jgi:hypothetical protein